MYSQLEMRKPYLELFSGDERKLFQGLIKLCLDDDASNRPIMQALLPQMKRVEKAVLQSSSAQEEDSNVQLAMWRMQRELEKKENEVVRTNDRKAELVSQSSTAVQEVTDLRESIENVHLRLRLHGRSIPNVPHFDGKTYEMAPHSANEPSLQLLPVNFEESPEARRPWCFRQGKSVCCLFTVRLQALMFIWCIHACCVGMK